MFKHSILSQSLCAAVLAGAGFNLHADERMFTYNYEAVSILPKGGVEFEQWITYRGGKEDGTYSRWDIREEIEFGVTDRYTTALYLNFRDTYRDNDSTPGTEEDEFEFKGVSSEHKYQFLNPRTKPIGLLGYGEVTTDGNELELEEKIILQKFFGADEQWNAVFNLITEQEWEYESEETGEESVLEFTAGLSYRLNQNWAVGVEARHHRVYEGIYSDELANAWFVGPNLHYGTGKWWGTLTVLPQIGGHPDTRGELELDEHTVVEVRLIAGYNF